jgi:hypothetical protein
MSVQHMPVLQDSPAVAIARAHARHGVITTGPRREKVWAADVHVTATTTQPAMPTTDLTGVEDYMRGLIEFAQAVVPGSARRPHPLAASGRPTAAAYRSATAGQLTTFHQASRYSWRRFWYLR